jgi:hypothetical protein
VNVRKMCAVLGGLIVLVPLVAFTIAHAVERREELGAYKLFVDTIKIPGDLAGGLISVGPIRRPGGTTWPIGARSAST